MESLLDQSRKFIVLGPDEYIWFFSWESDSSSIIYSWHAYHKRPGQEVYLPIGPWSESSVVRFLDKHMRKLNDSDRIDLHLYLHKGGLEMYLRKHRTKEIE